MATNTTTSLILRFGFYAAFCSFVFVAGLVNGQTESADTTDAVQDSDVPAIKSGLDVGADVVAWEPRHFTGPDKGTNTCPVCTYLRQPAVLVFAKDNSNARKLAQQLERLAAKWKHKKLKVFFIFVDGIEKTMTGLDTDFLHSSLCLLDSKSREEDLKKYSINSDADNTVMVYQNFVVRSNFANVSASNFDIIEQAVLNATPGVAALSAENAGVGFSGTAGKNRKSGKFKKISGFVDTPTNNPTDMKFEINVDTTSINTDYRILTAHLRNQDFLHVEKFASAKFVSRSVASTDKQHVYNVTGTMTIHGVSNELQFPATIRITSESTQMKFSTTILQSKFGMDSALKASDDPVKIKFGCKLPPPKLQQQDSKE